MGFPRQKVKARRVAPSESGDERVSKFCFHRGKRVPGLQIHISWKKGSSISDSGKFPAVLSTIGPEPETAA